MKVNEKMVAYMFSRKILHTKYSRRIFQSINQFLTSFMKFEKIYS